ncbi:MAG: hypothetical protein IT446_11345 [Phycisphaerales bacterium]|nr:hypothetical protein [Phycisphaerales bacterium]
MSRYTMILGGLVLSAALFAWAEPSTQPSTQPGETGSQRADREMDRLLRPGNSAPKPLQPAPDAPTTDKTSGPAAVAPGAPSVNVLREGTLVVDRVGHLTRSADGQQMEFTFDSDGKAMKDPPLILLPNLKLMAIENELTRTSRDLKFKISGVVTEYRGRNYILLDKVVIVPESSQQF